jgi:hypothetical protein
VGNRLRHIAPLPVALATLRQAESLTQQLFVRPVALILKSSSLLEKNTDSHAAQLSLSRDREQWID